MSTDMGENLKRAIAHFVRENSHFYSNFLSAVDYLVSRLLVEIILPQVSSIIITFGLD